MSYPDDDLSAADFRRQYAEGEYAEVDATGVRVAAPQSQTRAVPAAGFLTFGSVATRAAANVVGRQSRTVRLETAVSNGQVRTRA